MQLKNMEPNDSAKVLFLPYLHWNIQQAKKIQLFIWSFNFLTVDSMWRP